MSRAGLRGGFGRAGGDFARNAPPARSRVGSFSRLGVPLLGPPGGLPRAAPPRPWRKGFPPAVRPRTPQTRPFPGASRGAGGPNSSARGLVRAVAPGKGPPGPKRDLRRQFSAPAAWGPSSPVGMPRLVALLGGGVKPPA